MEGAVVVLVQRETGCRDAQLDKACETRSSCHVFESTHCLRNAYVAEWWDWLSAAWSVMASMDGAWAADAYGMTAHVRQVNTTSEIEGARRRPLESTRGTCVSTCFDAETLLCGSVCGEQMLAADDPATGIPVHEELANPDHLLGISKASKPSARSFPLLM